MRSDPPPSGIITPQNFGELASFDLLENEMGLSILSTSLGEHSPAAFVVVGTAFVSAAEPEPSAGRLLVFELQAGWVVDLVVGW